MKRKTRKPVQTITRKQMKINASNNRILSYFKLCFRTYRYMQIAEVWNTAGKDAAIALAETFVVPANIEWLRNSIHVVE